MLEGHNVNLTMSTQDCKFVEGTKTFIDCGAVYEIPKRELDIVDGDQVGEKIITLMLSNLSEPVELVFEAYKDFSDPSGDIHSDVAFVLIQGYCTCSIHV